MSRTSRPVLDSVFTSGPLWGAAAAVFTALCGWLVQRTQARVAVSAALAKAQGDDRAAAFAELMSVVATLKQRVEDLSEELDQERTRRREFVSHLQKELDEALEGRRAAINQVQELRNEVHRLRKELNRIGGVVENRAVSEPQADGKPDGY